MDQGGMSGMDHGGMGQGGGLRGIGAGDTAGIPGTSMPEDRKKRQFLV